MLISEFISKLRQFVGDMPTLTGQKFDGDGSTKVFRLKYTPILESSYSILVDTTTKVEDTHYTLDRYTGDLEFNSAPAGGSDNVEAYYRYVFMTDEDWIDAINSILEELKNKIWLDETDISTLTTVANQDEYDLDDIDENIFRVIEFMYRSNSNDNWTAVNTDTNVKYMVEQNKINVRPHFESSGYELRVRYLKYFSKYSSSSEELTLPVKFHEMLKHFCYVTYLDRLIIANSKSLGANVTERTFEPLNNLINLRSIYLNKAETMLARIKPKLPSTNIPTIKYGKSG